MDSNSTTTDSAWYEQLPLDLILKIHSFLDSRVARIRFRSICSSWRSSTPKPPPSPNPRLARFPIPHTVSIRPPLTLSLSLSEIYHLYDPSPRSLNSSIVALEEGITGKLSLRHPMSDKNLTNCPKLLNLANLSVVLVGKLFHLKCASRGKKCLVDYTRVVASLDDDDVEKSSNLDKERLSLARFSDVIVMGIFDAKLMCFRFKEETKWRTIIHGAPSFPYSDVIYWKGKFYAVDEARRLVIVDSLMNVEVVNSPDVLSAGLMSHSDKSYLVNLVGDLHLVVLYYEEENDIRDPFNTKFLIYRFEDAERNWVRILSLRDWAIFVSRFGSFGVCVPEVSLIKKNCICFQMDIQAECSSYEKDDVCFTAVYDVARGSCDDFARDSNSHDLLSLGISEMRI